MQYRIAISIIYPKATQARTMQENKEGHYMHILLLGL
jgi:hypothetical protein